MTELALEIVRTTLAVPPAAPTYLVADLDPPAVLEVAPRGASLAVQVVRGGVLVAPAAQGPAGPPGSSAAKATYAAATVVSGDKALMFAGAGRVLHADPGAASYVFAGISASAAQAGGPVDVQALGDVVASFWSWTPFAPVFVASGGDLTQSPPASGRSHLIGWALDAHTIHLDPDPVVTFA